MGTEYYIYSEVYNEVTDHYDLLNRYIENPTEDFFMYDIADTNYGKSYLYDLYELIRKNGKRVDIDTLDKPLKPIEDTDIDFEMYEISYNEFIDLYKKLKKNHGYVFIDEIENTEFDEYYSIKEYMQITDSEVKSKLKYHEWYINADLATSMEETIEHTKWLLYDYNSLNHTYYTMNNVKFILNVSY